MSLNSFYNTILRKCIIFKDDIFLFRMANTHATCFRVECACIGLASVWYSAAHVPCVLATGVQAEQLDILTTVLFTLFINHCSSAPLSLNVSSVKKKEGRKGKRWNCSDKCFTLAAIKEWKWPEYAIKAQIFLIFKCVLLWPLCLQVIISCIHMLGQTQDLQVTRCSQKNKWNVLYCILWSLVPLQYFWI